jgi:hypothetical protein
MQTLNCVGYDHNWVRAYDYDDDYAPLLPKGTILHIIGYFDSTSANKMCRNRATGRDQGTAPSPTCSLIWANS